MEIAKKIGGEWWITNVPHEIGDVGPYRTKQDATTGRQGLARTFRSDEWKTFIRDTATEGAKL